MEPKFDYGTEGAAMTIIQKVAILFVCLLAAYGLMGEGLTVEVQDINIVRINVPNQSQADFQKVLPQAFSEGLVRMSGNTAIIMTLPTIQNSLPKLSNYVEKYSYVIKKILLENPVNVTGSLW